MFFYYRKHDTRWDTSVHLSGVIGVGIIAVTRAHCIKKRLIFKDECALFKTINPIKFRHF